MRFLFVVFALLAALVPADAAPKKPAPGPKVAAEEKRFLDLVATLPYTTTYDELKKLVPEVGALKEYAGDDNTEAKLETRLFGLPATVSFSFHKGVLVSHGAHFTRPGGLSVAQATGIYTAARDYLRSRFGEGREHAGYDEDPSPMYMWICSWKAKGSDFGMYRHRHGKSAYEAGWGAQAAAKE